jgi:hypothetical protein
MDVREISRSETRTAEPANMRAIEMSEAARTANAKM